MAWKQCKQCKIRFFRRGTKGIFHSVECYGKSRVGVKRTHNMSGKNNPKWRGGRVIDKDGYVLVYCPSHPHPRIKCYVLEHRLKIEKRIGRYLRKNEVIHHKNNNKQDNRLSNLVLMTKKMHDDLHRENLVKSRWKK